MTTTHKELFTLLDYTYSNILIESPTEGQTHYTHKLDFFHFPKVISVNYNNYDATITMSIKFTDPADSLLKDEEMSNEIRTFIDRFYDKVSLSITSNTLTIQEVIHLGLDELDKAVFEEALADLEDLSYRVDDFLSMYSDSEQTD